MDGEDEITVLRLAVDQFGQHLAWCQSLARNSVDAQSCNCGWDHTRKTLQKLRVPSGSRQFSIAQPAQ
jgi:hypothetical protein